MSRRTDAISDKVVAHVRVAMLRVFAYLLVHLEYDRTFTYVESYADDRVTLTMSADSRVFWRLHREITHAISDHRLQNAADHVEQQMKQPEAS